MRKRTPPFCSVLWDKPYGSRLAVSTLHLERSIGEQPVGQP